MAVGLDDVKRIHLIGVGGCSMSGIAQILKKQGHEVTGSDRERSQFTDRLEELGIPVSVPQKGEQVEGAELVIYSAAIKPDNPERAYAREHGIPEMERSVALGQISARYPHVAAISGCHGKTTITSMLAYINEEAKLDATVHVGGFVDLLGGGVKVGDGDLFITEACEYVRSFLTLVPTVALVNNIDNDHLDCYKDQQEIIETFAQFCALVPPEGEIIVCRDDEKVQRLLPLLDRTPLTYGLAEGDWHADAVEFDSLGCASFDLVHEGNTLGRITLHVPGTHNVINAIGACAVASVFGAGFDSMAKALDRFRNTKRRFEFMGEPPQRDRRHVGGRQPGAPQGPLLRLPVQQLHPGPDPVLRERDLLPPCRQGPGPRHLPRPGGGHRACPRPGHGEGHQRLHGQRPLHPHLRGDPRLARRARQARRLGHHRGQRQRLRPDP